MRSAGCRRGSPTSSFTTISSVPAATWDSAAGIALPSLRDVEYEYGEGSSLREVATGAAASEVAGGAGAGQPPVFFSFNRFDATNPAPADELMASFPRLRFMLPEIVLIENERGRFLQVNSLGPVYPGRVARFTRMVASAPDPPAHEHSVCA